MLVSLIKKGKITNFRLPSTIQGNYWITDTDVIGNTRNLINIEAKDNNWILKSNFETKIISNGNTIESEILNYYQFYFLQLDNKSESMLLYSSPIYDKSNVLLNISNNNDITIGRKKGLDVYYNNPNIGEIHATIKNGKGGEALIINHDDKFGTYVNKRLIVNKKLEPGDIIFILGLKIIYCGKFIVINNPKNLVTINDSSLSQKQILNLPVTEVAEDEYLEIYSDSDYFFRSPRFRTMIEEKKINIDPPPEKVEEENTPIFYTIGPMLTMGMISLVMAVNNISQVISGQKTFVEALPNLIISFAMICTMMLWPILMKKYEKKKRIEKEKRRQERYSKYIDTKKKEIENIIVVQKQILLENNISLEQCRDIIFSKKRNLWEKDTKDDDFLAVRLGIGNLLPKIEINYPQEHFSMMDDNLKDILFSVVKSTKLIENVPISLSLATKNITALVGETKLTKESLESLLLQIITFHNYANLKIVLFTNKTNSYDYDYLKILPHCWSNDKTMRFFATNLDDAKQVSNNIEQVLESRQFKDGESRALNDKDYHSYDTYYIVIVDDLKLYRNLGIVREILESTVNYGFSLLIRNDKLSNLPNECSTFISIGGQDGKGSGFFENELVSDKQKMFAADLNNNRINMYQCAMKLANIPIKLETNNKQLPNVLSFLEMYNVGNIEQLNIINRWKQSNPTLSLQVPVGVDEQGELFKLDLHEKFHGPHGLIAGMTGSGKSEFIITYILSLAANFHPYELSFVLIDYKGGGLAGAFKNQETGIKLPHLAGTITNLDTIEMKRSLDSIKSELRRRQIIFNNAREQLNESTIDIYKYQRLYRDGLVKEPISHLFIISDEFAELKQQQPEFMTQLISTARIGRSLGVHLILATQKPSGVVDDQIWSNSKFRICLKVQDKSDSMDMIKCPDAAALKEVGRFFLQVGYNEFFAMGQSAWSGATYFPKEKLKKRVDTSLNFVDNIGYSIKVIEDVSKSTAKIGHGEELSNIVKYLSELAQNQKINIPQLWLDKIPNTIFVEDLKKKYGYTKQKAIINPIIGEFDDPTNQRQGLLTLPLSKNGNTVIFGAAGSGKENMLTTIIYSSIIYYKVEEVNFYIVDLGTEMLRMFKKAPHIGDIAFSNEEEKIINLFKMLNEIIDKRRQLLVKYNGNFNLYNTRNKEKLPTIIVIINGYEAFSEIYEKYIEDLFSLTRDCVKYGIIFILTANSSSSIRYKLRQNFKELICLQLNDKVEYNDVFGRVNGVYPSEIFGRGLVKLDSVYEFQTAFAYRSESLNEYVQIVCDKLKNMSKTAAKKIPILPDIIDLAEIKPYLDKLTNVPIGIKKDSLDMQLYDFKTNYGTMVSAIYSSAYESFILGLINEFSLISKTKTIVIDADGLINIKLNCYYYNKNFDEIYNQLNKLIDSYLIKYQASGFNLNSLDNVDDLVCVFVGINSFIKKLSNENKKDLAKLFSKGKELKKISFVFADTIDVFKANEYEEWFKNAITNNQGIWLGTGLMDQYTIKVSRNPKSAREEIPDNFGFVIQKGTAELVKFLEGDSNE